MQNENVIIFVVDDDPFCLGIYEKHLHNMGYKDVFTFTNGVDCINGLHKSPDIVFTDYMMLPMDGLSVVKEVKKKNPGIYAIVISGQQDNTLINSSYELGAFEYIAKGENELKNIKIVLDKIQHINRLVNN